MDFINRKKELSEFDKVIKNGRLIVVYGRRRVGKTRLLARWLKSNAGVYTQAIEASKNIQISQIYKDIKAYLNTNIEPKTWQELFELIDLVKKPMTFCIDEFPYLVKSDPSLPSIIQSWLDHRKNKVSSIVLCGSSYHMLHQTFIHHAAPLYGRAFKLIQIEPMTYKDFCSGLKLNVEKPDVFTKYALVGGVPKYWELVEDLKNAEEYADELYFGHAPYMQNEPMKLLMDEDISGQHSLSVLEAIGRGASRPSEIASRLGIKQTQLSKVIYRLMDSSLIKRDIAFGEPEKNPKRVLYSISDPSLRFWYSVYSPHRSRWRTYTKAEKQKLIHDFASTVFEDFCRNINGPSWRYWEKDLEIDLIQIVGKNKLSVGEIKYKLLTKSERKKAIEKLQSKWNQSKYSKKYTNVDFSIMDQNILKYI